MSNRTLRYPVEWSVVDDGLGPLLADAVQRQQVLHRALVHHVQHVLHNTTRVGVP